MVLVGNPILCKGGVSVFDFLGVHDVILDDKSRIIFPAVLRKDNKEHELELLVSTFYVTPHIKGYLTIYPGKEAWESYKQSIQDDSVLSGSQKRKFLSDLNKISFKLRLDKQKRLCLNQKQRAYFTFEDKSPRQELTMYGCGGHVKIWPKALAPEEKEMIAGISKRMDEFDGE